MDYKTFLDFVLAM